jgi:hypothetical protein|tara:strand:+ start:236 stop:499 length:264 start_codon:yes stop_codon:yes gene_type:complete
MMNLQYIKEDAVIEFIDKMGAVTTESILGDEAIVNLLSGSVPPQIKSKDNPLGTVECFLQLFIDREEYEVCQQLIDVHPQLLITLGK